ncbi:hypothetical protein GMOD_00010364 [Pyrenophora seminiperda CCB06]|uniref:Uncharacterized protein n=1 Tax=Pyrenophora seminiperda CCB06 TaxID=1302712 RepID=A0A3M7M5B9_9PLEO|nr:hypothetical protein GMOD_00010364 [Pyrenophora seminiperda CCB06]
MSGRRLLWGAKLYLLLFKLFQPVFS